MEVVYAGVDQLDVAFQGALPRRALAALEAAKEEAQEGQPARCELGGVSGMVKHSGAKGGYAFIFETVDGAETWKFKRNPDPQEWNIFAEVRSQALATDGYAVCRDRLIDRLESFGAKVIAESVNRVDYAVDIVAPGFEPSPENIVCHPKSGVASHEEIERGGSGFYVKRAGRKVQTITVGKMPGRQVQIYDKRAEQIRPHMPGYWFEIWGFEREDCPQVWRVEIRAGKKHLQDWNVRTFADVDAAMGDVFRRALADVRYVEHTDVSNISRAPIHPLWELVFEQVAEGLADHVAGITRGRVVATKRDAIERQYAAQIKGLAAGLSVVRAYSEREAFHRIAADVASLVGEGVAEAAKFRRTRRRAEDRFIFLDVSAQERAA